MNYKMNIDELKKIADACVNMPWGMGDSLLLSMPEAWNAYYRFLYMVVRAYGMEAVVECGSYMANASKHMALARPDCTVVAVDKEFHELAFTGIVRFPNLKFVTGDTCAYETFKIVSREVGDKKIGLLFIDSNHDGLTAQMELAMYRRLFADECLVCVDDITLNDPMKKCWEFLAGKCEEHVELNFLHDHPLKVGFGVMIERNHA